MLLSGFNLVVDSDKIEAVMKALMNEKTTYQKGGERGLQFKVNNEYWLIDISDGQLFHLNPDLNVGTTISLDPGDKEHFHILALARYNQLFT